MTVGILPLVSAALFCAAAIAVLAGAWLRMRRAHQMLAGAHKRLLQIPSNLPDFNPIADRMEHERHALDRLVDLKAPLRRIFIVCGFPKTGNATLAATIGELDVCDFLYGGHHFSDLGIADLARAVGGIGDPKLRARQLAYSRDCEQFNTIFSRRARMTEEARAAGMELQKPFLVSAVRDPVAILLSGIYFVHANLEGDPSPPSLETLQQVALGGPGLSAEALRVRDLWFRTNTGRRDDGSPWWLAMDEWFDRELLGAFGIDAFGQEFDRDRGWSLVESDRTQALLLRQEDFGSLATILQQTLGLPPGRVEVLSENQADRRSDAALYRQAREQFRLPAEALERIYGSRMARHFYAPREIERMQERWVG